MEDEIPNTVLPVNKLFETTNNIDNIVFIYLHIFPLNFNARYIPGEMLHTDNVINTSTAELLS